MFLSLTLCHCSALAWNLKDALRGAVKDSATESSVSTALGNLLSTDRITVRQMEGEWQYSAPAVTFKSDDVLERAGGAAASGAIINKLGPIYNKAGFDKARLTVTADSSFVLKTGKMTFKGTIMSVSDKLSGANFVFRFSVGGKLKIIDADTYVTKNVAGEMSVMFDVTKLVTLMDVAGKLSGYTTFQSAVKLFKRYDGLCAGFAFKRTK